MTLERKFQNPKIPSFEKLKKNINLERSSLTKPKNGSARLPQLQEG